MLSFMGLSEFLLLKTKTGLKFLISPSYYLLRHRLHLFQTRKHSNNQIVLSLLFKLYYLRILSLWALLKWCFYLSIPRDTLFHSRHNQNGYIPLQFVRFIYFRRTESKQTSNCCYSIYVPERRSDLILH